jgi:uncharacterized membrane protein YkoI
MYRPTIKSAAGLGAVAALAFGGTQVAIGASNSSSTKKAAAKSQSSGKVRSSETELTGATADSVKAALLAKYPGATISRMSIENDGRSTDAYEAHIVKSDGTRLEVFLDKAFAVTGSQADDHGGRGGRHGHGRGGPGNGEKPVTGATLDSITSAVKAKYSGSTVDRASTETDGKAGDAYEAKITKSDGTRLEVFLDKAFKITGEEAQKEGHR